MLRRSLKKRGARLLLRFSATGLGELVAGYVSLLNRLLHNDSGDIELNGEGWLLKPLGMQQRRVVLDVGANQGDWSARALRPRRRSMRSSRSTGCVLVLAGGILCSTPARPPHSWGLAGVSFLRRCPDDVTCSRVH